MKTGEQCGVLQLAFNNRVAQLHNRLSEHFGDQQLFRMVDKIEASRISGVEQVFGGLYFPQSGWIDPKALCSRLVEHPNIHVCPGSTVEQLQQSGDQSWKVSIHQAGKDEVISTNTVVLCTSTATNQIRQTAQLPIKPIRGQVTNLISTELSFQLETVVCGDGYISPAHNDTHCLGATFNHSDHSQLIRSQDHIDNLSKLKSQIPALGNSLSPDNIKGGRVGFRCTTPDYLPIVGAAPHFENYLRIFAPMRKHARASIPSQGPVWSNLFVNLGHGSRGLAYTPICAELLAARINNEPTPVGYNIETALHPARFWIRDLSRGKL